MRSLRLIVLLVCSSIASTSSAPSAIDDDEGSFATGIPGDNSG